MIKGLTLTPPVIGRISIGRVVEKNGKRLPEKDDEFTITSQLQHKDGWIAHPQDEALRGASGSKLRSIPIKLLFNDPDLNMRAQYTLFNRTTGRPACVGNGESCRRVTADGIQTFECRTPDGCDLAQGNQCKPYGRLNVRIGDEDELGTFIFRTTGFNSIRTLLTRMRYFQAVSGGLLANLSLELRLRGKSTTQSHRAPVFYVDLTLRPGTNLVDAIKAAQDDAAMRAAAGVNQAELDEAARQGFAMGAFEDSEEDGAAIAEEFYPEGNLVNVDAPDSGRLSSRMPDRLTRKLNVLSSQVSSSEDSR
jgi:hypothetical protein